MNASFNSTSNIHVGLLLLFAFTMGSIGILHIHRRHQVVRLGYELSDTHAELTKLEEDNRRLNLELSMLTKPERIESLAASLGFIWPAPEQVRSIHPLVLAQNHDNNAP